jgi:hypothetical protein
MEGRGIPSVGVATEAFREAAAAQADMLGFDPAYVWVPHPIQDRTDEELRALADTHFEEIWTALGG